MVTRNFGFDRSAIVRSAHSAARILGIKFGEAQRLAWSVVRNSKIVQCLRSGIVRFKFQKADGSIRTAVGTLDQNLFTYEFSGREASKNQVRYFDLEANDWRSFVAERLIKICSLKPTCS